MLKVSTRFLFKEVGFKDLYPLKGLIIIEEGLFDQIIESEGEKTVTGAIV